ncbi:MAG: hypothetical protein LBF97_03285 [Elusimicrobiota bacterium]|jgi:hypothetical protein|nr:hypothetical protein [Elusimicrobiota bacterium]
MAYTKENGYIPTTFDDIMIKLMQGINSQFNTNYTIETFQGTNFYKYFYALAQLLAQDEIDTSLIFERYKDYIRTTNEKIAIPKTPIIGLIDTFDKNGIKISVRKVTTDNAGRLAVCALLDASASDYQQKKQLVLEILAQYTVAGLFYDGTETGSITLSNNQVFDFAFYLPNYFSTNLKLTINLSHNTQLISESIDVIQKTLLNNIAANYSLGVDFEPEKYFTISRDANYASKVLLEYSNSKTSNVFVSSIYTASFQDFFTFDQQNVEVIIV